MVEAVNTTASTLEIWAIVIVATCCLVFWLTMVVLADRRQVKDSGLTPPPEDQALSAAQGGAAQRDLPAGFEMPAQRASEEPIRADAPTRPDLPAQPGMPAQRSGDGDRAERSGAARRDRRWP